ncbi:hypothetical protein [Kribbella sp. NPDC023855]|uniref:hypothetical protein n=1 Tax=Kribbella sp. NPDC023855 TaxID=3154698 RepID=UPI0033CA7CFA
MAEESWHQARLIPTSGINGADEQERRATSALLAVMTSVREFGRVLIQPLGAPSGALEAFIEVPFQFGERRLYPDGLLRARRGQKQWTALVEVKTGVNQLETEQLEAYLDIAHEQGFDAVITISNEIPAMAGMHPAKVDKRKVRRVALHHWSWSMVLAEAVLQKEHRGVADPDQAWILGELIRYLEHPRSGALQFEDMSSSWVTTREAVAAGTLRPGDKCAPEVAARFDALLRYVSLQLGRRLGDDVTPALSRKELAEPALRSQALVQSMCTTGTMQGAISIPNAVGPLVVTADLRAGQAVCHVDVAAPKDGKPTTRVNWLVRQLRHAPETVRLEAFTLHSRGPGTAELLKNVREQPTVLIEDPRKELRSFQVALTLPLGTKRGRGRGAFIDSVENAINTFYGEVMQDLRAWTAAPPRLRETPEQPEERPSLTSTALSSQDGQEPEPSRPDDAEHELTPAAAPAEPSAEPARTAEPDELQPVVERPDHEPPSPAPATDSGQGMLVDRVS